MSGVAENAAKRFPSAASRTSSSCEIAAPAMTGIGGSESSSKHTAGRYSARRLSALQPCKRVPHPWTVRQGREAVDPGRHELAPADTTLLQPDDQHAGRGRHGRGSAED